MKEYSFANVSFFVNGTEIEGYDEGDDVIMAERLNDSATYKVGVDGEMTVNISVDRSGQFVFRLLSSSKSNGYLSSLFALQDNGAFTPLLVMLKDIKGNDLAHGSQGFIKKPSPIKKGAAVTSQEWTIVVETLNMIHAGFGE